MKIVFMGTPQFAVPIFERIAPSVVAVYTQPPKPRNRGYCMTKTPVHEAAEKYGIEIRCPTSLKDEIIPECDLAVVAAYGLLLPKSVLERPKKGCWNVHASLLPRWRGAAPIQRAILAGDTKTGITIMQMDTGLDTGDMLLWDDIFITEDMTFAQLHDQLSIMGADLIERTLQRDLSPQKQPQEGVTYASKIQKEEGVLDNSLSALDCLLKIRALNPWPGTRMIIKNQDVRILRASQGPMTSLEPGTLFDNVFLACANQSSIKLEILQRAGGKSMDAYAFMNGF